MSTILILARFALFAVFAVAAVAKLADLPGSRRALEGFGVPSRFASTGALVLPAGEVLAALLLVAPATTQAGAALAAVLLAAFVVGIVHALRQGRTPDCHCFGQLHSKPAGRETIARNAVLLGVAVFIGVAGPGPSAATWLGDRDAAEIALVVTALTAAVLAYACVALWRENRRLTGHGPAAPEPIAPLAIGHPVPAFSLLGLDGSEVLSSEVLEGQPTVLVFVSSSCAPCAQLLPELARWKGMLAGRLGIHVVAAGEEAEIKRLADQHSFPMLVDLGGEIARSFNVPATPCGIELDGDGAVASLPASGSPAIEGMIRTALKRSTTGFALSSQRVHAGNPAPSS